MAEDSASDQDKTEEATPERREEFREKGHVVVSREITSALLLMGTALFLSLYLPQMISSLQTTLKLFFEMAGRDEVSAKSVIGIGLKAWLGVLIVIVPIFLVDLFLASGSTLLQTRFNWSWEKLSPDFSRLNPLSGVVRMVNMQAAVELLKGLAKLAAVTIVSFLILKGEWTIVPGLMNASMLGAWGHWAEITKQLLWSVGALLVAIGGLDYFYNFMAMEKKMRMSKQEVKEEYKKREVDPHVKARVRRMQRDMVMQKTISKTKEATVIITNPEHYAVALKYELGMAAPIVIAKGVDFLAQRMKEVARENDIPIIENKPLARTLYKLVEAGQDIPESLYKAVSEVIRYVFQLKGIKIQPKTQRVA